MNQDYNPLFVKNNILNTKLVLYNDYEYASVALEGKSALKQLYKRVARQGFQKHRKANQLRQVKFLSVKFRREACSPLAYAYERSAGSNPVGGINLFLTSLTNHMNTNEGINKMINALSSLFKDI